jgi:hypothetical protein
MLWIDEAEEVIKAPTEASRERVDQLLSDYDLEFEDIGGMEVYAKLKRLSDASAQLDKDGKDLLGLRCVFKRNSFLARNPLL